MTTATLFTIFICLNTKQAFVDGLIVDTKQANDMQILQTLHLYAKVCSSKFYHPFCISLTSLDCFKEIYQIFVPPLNTACPVILPIVLSFTPVPQHTSVQFTMSSVPRQKNNYQSCKRLAIIHSSQLFSTSGKEVLITTLYSLKCRANCFLHFRVSFFYLCRLHAFWVGLTCMIHFQVNT